jgi:hypothetical protein
VCALSAHRLAAPHVFGLRHGLQVLRVRAQRCSAQVIQHQTFWHRAMMVFVDDYVRMPVSSVPNVDMAVSTARLRTTPQPAAVFVAP